MSDRLSDERLRRLLEIHGLGLPKESAVVRDISAALAELIDLRSERETLRDLLARAQINVPDFCVNWHANARDALSPEPARSNPPKEGENDQAR